MCILIPCHALQKSSQNFYYPHALNKIYHKIQNDEKKL